MKWIKVKDQLPPEGKYILARHSRGSWIDSRDQENVNCVVVRLEKGISSKERERLSKGNQKDIERSNEIRGCDQGGNNKVPYCFYEFGPDSFFGQDISHWMEIPSL